MNNKEIIMMQHMTKQENTEYFIGMICLFLGIALIGFALYLLPYALFNIKYSVPAFVINIRAWLELNHGLHGRLEMLVLFLPIVMAGAVFLYLAREFTADLESKEARLETDTPGYLSNLEPPEAPPVKQYKVHPLIINLSVILLVLVLLILAEWLILGIV
jgi:hypothetical protein